MEIKKRERISCVCVDCNKPFSVNPVEQRFYEEKGLAFPKRCSQCRANRHIVKKFICIDCGNTFTMSLLNMEYFKKKGMQLPKRCESCRKDKREFEKIRESRNINAIANENLSNANDASEEDCF